jgi:GxxExxY protein
MEAAGAPNERLEPGRHLPEAHYPGPERRKLNHRGTEAPRKKNLERTSVVLIPFGSAASLPKALGRNRVLIAREAALTRDPLTEKVIGAAIEVHRHLGPGLLESVYEECLFWELGQAGLKTQRQVPLPVVYKEVKLDMGYRLDLLVQDELSVELKTVEKLLPIHEAQVLTYLKLSGIKTGLLLNFHSAVLRNGIKRMVL